MMDIGPFSPLRDHLDRIARQEDLDGLSRAVWQDAPAAAHLLRTGRDPGAGRSARAAALARRLAAADTGLYPRPWLDAPLRSVEGCFTRAVHDDGALAELWSALVDAVQPATVPAIESSSRLHLALGMDAVFGDLLRYEVVQLYPHGQPVVRPRPLVARMSRPILGRLRDAMFPTTVRCRQ